MRCNSHARYIAKDHGHVRQVHAGILLRQRRSIQGLVKVLECAGQDSDTQDVFPLIETSSSVLLAAIDLATDHVSASGML
jgi:hypothetical protein